jgi:hypothetical protein
LLRGVLPVVCVGVCVCVCVSNFYDLGDLNNEVVKVRVGLMAKEETFIFSARFICSALGMEPLSSTESSVNFYPNA